MRYLVFIIALFAALQTNAQNNIVYGAGINYTNGAPTFTPPVRTSRVAIDTVTGKWYHFNTPGGWQLIGNTIEEIAGCTAPAYTPGKGDSKVVINNCSPQPELYFWNGSAWVLVGGGSVYAGEGIRIENDTIILDSLYVLKFRTGDTTDLNAGAVSWNAGEQTLDVVINQGAVTGQMFQEVLYFTKNQTGAQINDGTVVMAAGTTGNSGKILIAPAIADGSVNSEYILGLATQNLPNGGEGMVTHFGKVRGIQTNGANYGETWVDGDVLYCSAATPGYLTKILPTAPNLKIPIAIVIHAHPSNGTLFVRPSHFPDLAQINDVQLTSPTNGQVLTYNSALSRWENATPANQLQTLSTDGSAGNISISSGNTITLNVNDADASATNELQTLSTGTNTLTLSNGGGTVTVDTNPGDDVTGSGTSGQVSFWTGAQTQSGDNGLFWDNTNKRLGINTTTPNSRLTISENSTGEVQILRAVNANAVGTSNFFSSAGTQYFLFGQAGESRGGTYITGVNNAGLSFFASFGSNVVFNAAGPGANLIFATQDAQKARITPQGRFAINLTNPQANLHVVGSGASSTTWTAQFHNSAGNNNALMIRDDGNVGIGTSAPAVNLDVAGRMRLGGNFTLIDNNNFAILGSQTNRQLINGTAGSITNNVGFLSGAADLVGSQAFTNANGVAFIMNNKNTNASNIVSAGQFTFSNDAANAGLANGYGVIARGLNSSTVTVPSIRVVYSDFLNLAAGAVVTDFSLFNANLSTNSGTLTNTYGFFCGDITRGTQTNTPYSFYASDANAFNYFAGRTGIGTTSPNASAILDVTSTTQGILFPRMTTAQRDLIATPADGLVIYNTTDNKLQVRAGGAWVDLH